jgi:thiol-disulfide isomerase/thioredoxin
MHDLKAMRANSEPIEDYIAAPSAATEAFNQRLQEYELNPTIGEKLKAYTGKAHIFAFSAEWCKDCKKNIPILKLIQDVTGIEVRVLGHIMKNAKNQKPSTPEEKWKFPPSPLELIEFKVFNIPYIAVFDLNGNELGAVIENPPEDKTLEEVLLEILEAA